MDKPFVALPQNVGAIVAFAGENKRYVMGAISVQVGPDGGTYEVSATNGKVTGTVSGPVCEKACKEARTALHDKQPTKLEGLIPKEAFKNIFAVAKKVKGDKTVLLHLDTKETFATGAQRDTQEGKSRPDLLPPDALLRVGQHYANGGRKYGDRNWERGMSFSRVNASLTRHLLQWQSGDRSEDHLSAMAFNVLALIAYEERIKGGLLPASLDDMRGS